MRQSQKRLGRCVALGCVAAVLAGMAGCGQTKSVESFCQTYEEEKTVYLARYGAGPASTGDELTDVFAGVMMLGSALGDIIIVFEKLAEVAPDDIASDLGAIHDSLVRQRDSAASFDPMSILGTAVTSALMTGGSWQRVSDYITVNCDAA